MSRLTLFFGSMPSTAIWISRSGCPLPHGGRRHRLQASAEPRVPRVGLLFLFGARQPHFGGVDDDDEVADGPYCGANMVLPRPRSKLAIWTASRPSVRPSASTSSQLRVMSCSLAMYVFTKRCPSSRETDAEDSRSGGECQPSFRVFFCAAGGSVEWSGVEGKRGGGRLW